MKQQQRQVDSPESELRREGLKWGRGAKKKGGVCCENSNLNPLVAH